MRFYWISNFQWLTFRSFISSPYCWARGWWKFPLFYSNKTGRWSRTPRSKRIHPQTGKVRRPDRLMYSSLFFWFSSPNCWACRRWELSLRNSTWFGMRRRIEKSKRVCRQTIKVCVVKSVVKAVEYNDLLNIVKLENGGALDFSIVRSAVLKFYI